MSVLLDASVILGYLSPRLSSHGEVYRFVQQEMFSGARGRVMVTDYIVDEVLTFLTNRGATARDLDRATGFLLGDPSDVAIRFVGPEDFATAAKLVRKFRDRRLSFTDCTSLAVMASDDIGAIASLDEGFDGLVPRLSPPPGRGRHRKP